MDYRELEEYISYFREVMEMVTDDILEWSNEVSSIKQAVSDFIQNNPIPKPPAYSEISNRQVLYQAYSDIVCINNVLTDQVIKVQSLLVTRSEIKKRIREAKLPPYIVTGTNRVIEEVSDMITAIDRMLDSYKMAVDNLLRFYQSVQYILSSPRLNMYQ